MTSQEAKAKHAQFPHLSLETIAYYAGRQDCGCEFTEPSLIAAYRQGRRDVGAEDRLDADTEWDED